MSQDTESPPLKPGVRCLACGSKRFEAWARAWDAEYHNTDERFTLHRCLDCRVLFIDPVPRDRLEEIYPSNY
jgi:DNA-directed RNA polymerase subunit RPC12/RpoP